MCLLLCLLENEIDGPTLELMNSVEKITTLIPKFKQQLIFLKEREKLFKVNDDYSIQCAGSSTVLSTSLNSSSSSMESMSDHLSKESLSNPTPNQSFDEQEINELFPDKYIIPPLPNALLKDIEDGAMHKFGPHFSNRQILVDATAHDLISKYNLFYPSHKQFDGIGAAMVEYLKLPTTKQNVAIWKDALQTKLKRKRLEHRDHIDVQQYQLKYSRIGSGRPVKKRIGEVAQRDRQKQIMLVAYDDITLRDIQAKSEKLRDISQVDVHNRLDTWKETIQFRRQYIRDNSTSNILKEFPGYSHPVLVFEEVKMTMKVDLSAAVRRQIPALLEKMTETPVFITDSAPIRLIKLLCRQFDETIHHIFCNTEPSTPYPTLVCIDDLLYIYVDFLPVVSTTSPDDALGLLIAMYTIFELCFNRNSRSIRLLYSILHGDTRFLPNTIRIFIKEKNIDIYEEQNRKQSTSSNVLSNNSTFNSSQSLTQLDIIRTCSSLVEDNDTNDHHPTYASSPQDNFDSNSNTTITIHDSNKLMEETSSLLIGSQNQKVNSRKRSQRLTKVTQETKKSFILTDDDDEDTQENSPSSKPKSNSISRQNKRKRRT